MPLATRISMILPFLSAGFVFIYRNWLNSQVCIQNILHHRWSLTPLAASKEWAEPYTMCLDPYWVNQWLKNYGAGFAKRGLLGTLSASVFDGRINLLLLNLITFLIVLMIVYGVVTCLYQLGGSGSLAEACVFTALLWLTPVGKSISETAGDPLQVVLILMLSAMLAIHRLQKRELACDAVLASFYSIAILIHEGTFLLFLPAYLIIGRRRWPWWLGLGLAITITVAFSRAENPALQEMISSRLTGFNPLTGMELQYRAGEGLAPQASFAYNGKMEFGRYLQDPRMIFGQVQRSFTLALFLALCVAIWIQGFSKINAQRYMMLWLLYIPLTLPFFLITHDWVRYAMINLLSCLFCLAATRRQIPVAPDSSGTASETIRSMNSPLKRILPWATLLAATLLLGPHANQQDIRTFPPARLGLKSTLLAVAAITLFTVNKRGIIPSQPFARR